jgi:flagellar hook-basal body complex protein FliE
MDIRPADAARLYLTARPATEPGTAQGGPATTMAGAARSFVETLGTAEATARDAMLGKADPHALVEALAQTELAIETAVALRNKVVEAYQEILRMPV